MTNKNKYFPKVSAVFALPEGNSNNALYRDVLRNNLKKILHEKLFTEAGDSPEILKKQKAQFESHLPFLTSSSTPEDPFDMSFYVLSKCRQDSFRFFYEMISHWLVPGKRLNVLLVYAADFRFPELSSSVYTICEVMIRVQNQDELDQVRRNLPIIEAEVRLGVESAFNAGRILEIKGLSADGKTALILQHITHLAKRLPSDFDQDVVTEMQHLLVICQDEFKAARNFRHLSRIISIKYLFRKAIRQAVKEQPTQRHLSLKLFKSTIRSSQGGEKRVLCVVVGLNFLKDKEIFNQKHLLKAIKNYIPNVKIAEHSFFTNRWGAEPICTLYLEIEKKDGKEFSGDEMSVLRKSLPNDLKDSIQHLMHPVFMPRNEEEIMRNILTLSNQIRFLRDIPQVSITFDEQTESNLFFTVILVRVAKPEQISIQDLFKEENTFLTYIPDRCKTVGFLRKKHPKEVTVFRLKFPKEAFLRSNHSVNLFEARQAVVCELVRMVGDFRDFNGGMISKQNELFAKVRKLIGHDLKYNDLLLEDFFYSLMPVIMQSLLQPEAFTNLFLMLLDSMKKGLGNETVKLTLQTTESFVFALALTSQRSVKDEIKRGLSKLHLPSGELANAYVQIYGVHYCGYVYRCDDPARQQNFCAAMEFLIPVPAII